MARKPTLDDLRAAAASGPPYDEEFLASLRSDGRAGARALHETCVRARGRVAAERERIRAMMRHEYEVQSQGFTRVAGVDEAGRGPLAGPIVAAAVVLAEPVPGLDDSKRLSPAHRDRLFDILHARGHGIGVAMIGPDIIDLHGIQSANYAAMAQAVAALPAAPDFLLVDGFTIRGCPLPQRRIIKGDRLSASIAAASIVAKVTRDRLMDSLDRDYPEYGFSIHKGYATAAHLDALRRLGPSPIHRKSFAPLSGSVETRMFL